MTRRRQVEPLCFTASESAEMLRVSENLFRAWIKAGVVRVVRWNSLDLVPRTELDRLIADALGNNGTLPALAVDAPSPGPATGVEGASSGAAASTAPTDSAARIGGEATTRPAAPTTKKERPAVTGRPLTTAG